MSELAFNVNGEPFEVPAGATGWRVKKMKAKGAPEVVYGRDGLPLVLPIDADLDTLRDEANSSGRFRLDLVDDTQKALANVTPGYVYVHPEREERSAEAPIASSALRPASDHVVLEAMRMNAEIAKSVVDRFPMMLEGAASLLRAADGAGMPARAPHFFEFDSDAEDDEDDDTGRPPAGFDFNAFLAQVAPLIGSAIASGKLKIPGLGDMFDWRKAAAKAPKPAQIGPAAIASADAATDAKPAVEPMIPPLDPETIAHFMAIQAALKPEEAALARAVAADLGPAELRTWFDNLKKLSISEAVAKIRALVAKKGGAS